MPSEGAGNKQAPSTSTPRGAPKGSVNCTGRKGTISTARARPTTCLARGLCFQHVAAEVVWSTVAAAPPICYADNVLHAVEEEGERSRSPAAERCKSWGKLPGEGEVDDALEPAGSTVCCDHVLVTTVGRQEQMQLKAASGGNGTRNKQEPMRGAGAGHEPARRRWLDACPRPFHHFCRPCRVPCCPHL